MTTEGPDKRTELTAGLLFLQWMLLYLPDLQFFSIQTDNGEIPASLCYFFSLVFVPLLAINIRQRRRLVLPPWWITGLAAYVILYAFVRLPRYGLSNSILHWLFGAYLLLVILNVGQALTREQWRRLLEAGTICFAVLHFVFLLWNWRTVWRLLSGYFMGTMGGYMGAILPSLTRGGRNLDCTWLVLGGFFVTGRKKAVYVTYVLLFSFLGSSRVGVIGAALLILWTLIYDPLYRLTKHNAKWYALYAVCMLAVLFGSGGAQAFLGRNLFWLPAPAQVLGIRQTGTSSSVQYLADTYGSAGAALLSGRAAIWKMVPQVFADNPGGYGVGNAMRVMRQSYGFTGYEDVVHNVFLQWLLDEGFIGGAWYIGLGLAFLRRQWQRRPRFFAAPFDGYFAVWFVLSLVEFHGGEALMIFVLGVYLLQMASEQAGEKKRYAA